MTLIVETGTGSSTADTYVSIADVETYWTAHGLTPSDWSSLSTAAQETHVRAAAQYIDAVFGPRFKGYRADKDQALAWPRYNVEDADGYLFSSTAIPTRVKRAQAEIVIRLVAGDDLLADLSPNGDIKRESVAVGSLKESIEYAGPSSRQIEVTKVEMLLAPYLNRGPSGGTFQFERG